MAMTKLWTVEVVIKQLPDDESRYALIRDVLHRMPPPEASDMDGLSVQLDGIWATSLRNINLASSSIRADSSSNVIPILCSDRIFPSFRSDRVPIDEDAYPEIAPDLVVEVVSPSQTGPSVEEKVAIYLATGVRLVWVIDPVRRTVAVH